MTSQATVRDNHCKITVAEEAAFEMTGKLENGESIFSRIQSLQEG